MKASKGEFIVFIDSDDRLVNNSLERAKFYISEYPNKDLFYSNIFSIDKNGKRMHTNTKSPEFAYETEIKVINTHLSIFRKSIALKCEGFNENLITCSDTNLWLKMYLMTKRMKHINEPLYEYRIHDENTSLRKNSLRCSKCKKYKHCIIHVALPKYRYQGINKDATQINFVKKYHPLAIKGCKI